MAQKIYVVFDGPPGPESGRFVEVEADEGYSLAIPGNGYEWEELPGRRSKHGIYSRLGPFYAEELDPAQVIQDGVIDLKEAEAKIERLLVAGDALIKVAAIAGSGRAIAVWEEAKNV